MMRRTLASALLAIAHSVTLAADLRIELVGCKPDGMTAILSEQWDAKAFWAREKVTLQMALERRWEFEEAIETCKTRHIDSPAPRQACVAAVVGRHDSMQRCFRHAAAMCRHHGGCNTGDFAPQ